MAVRHYPHEFTSVYSVSDIHLGGAKDDKVDFQIFANGERLATFIGSITNDEAEDSTIALVLNGDVIDSLAEDGVEYVALSERSAAHMITRVIDDKAFRPVWDALADFVQTRGRHVVFVGGNHDVELALPIVQSIIRTHLCGDDNDAHARLHFSANGGGYACFVAGRRIVFSHGNELDRANRVDHEKLGQLVLAQNGGRSLAKEEWTPNMGTRLVVDVMNKVKRRYPFVDLLKPQGGAVAAVLLIMGGREAFQESEAHWALPGLAASLARSRIAGGKILSSDEVASFAQMEDFADLLDDQLTIGPELAAELGTGSQPSLETRLKAIDAAVAADPAAAVFDAVEGYDDEFETLGFWRPARAAARVLAGLHAKEKDRKPVLRAALRDLAGTEGSFGPEAIGDPDDNSKHLTKLNSKGELDADFYVYGHTHKARAIELKGAADGQPRWYLNSGTWIRILPIDENMLKDANFETVWHAINAGTMEALTDAEVQTPDGPSGLLLDYATAVKITSDEGAVTASVLEIDADGATEVPGSQCTIPVLEEQS